MIKDVDVINLTREEEIVIDHTLEVQHIWLNQNLKIKNYSLIIFVVVSNFSV